MSDAKQLEEVKELLLAYYASKNRYPRPNEVTAADIVKVEDLATKVAKDWTQRLEQAIKATRPNEQLLSTIRSLDSMVDTYEDAGNLVSHPALSFGLLY